MFIKLLKLDIEFEDSVLKVFHTGGNPGNEPPTVITINEKDFEGAVEFYEDNDTYIIKIIKQ